MQTLNVTLNFNNSSAGGGKGKGNKKGEGATDRWVTTLGDSLGKAFSQIVDLPAQRVGGKAVRHVRVAAGF